jgi:tetratricopeptide (TPR) repeat protein
MMKRILFLLASIALFWGALVPLTKIRVEQPAEMALSFYPPAQVIKALSGEHYHFLSQVILLNCVFYYGTLVEKKDVVPNWQRMYEALYTSAHLDPYNMDTYYLAQALFPWEAGMVGPTIELLEYGFAHRSWDWYLPLFLSFDYAYFLRDYEKAGDYMAKAAALNKKAGYFYTLSARFYYEAGRTALALAYLKELIPNERNQHVKQLMINRAAALEAILALEQAVEAFRDKHHRRPKDLQEIQQTGFIDRIPIDPYGGNFYLDSRGRVRTTSRLAKGEK